MEWLTGILGNLFSFFTNRKQRKQQNEINEYALEEERQKREKARVIPQLIKNADGRLKLRISNESPVAARNVDIEFPEGIPGSLAENELKVYFPRELLENGDPVDIGVFPTSIKEKRKICLTWHNPDGVPGSDKRDVVF